MCFLYRGLLCGPESRRVEDPRQTLDRSAKSLRSRWLAGIEPKKRQLSGVKAHKSLDERSLRSKKAAPVVIW